MAAYSPQVPFVSVPRTHTMAFDLALERPRIGVSDVEAVIAAGLFGAFQGGLMLQLWDLDGIRRVGATVGVTSLEGAWLVLLCYGVLLAVPFVWFVSGSVDAWANSVILLSSKSAVLQRVLVPLLKFSALGITLFGLGQIYGLLVGIFVYGLAMPAWLNLVGYATPVPYINGFTLFGWATYGGMTGLAYGLVIES